MQKFIKKELTPIVYGEVPVRVLEFNVEKNKSCFRQHWHERVELHLVKKGSFELSCNGERVIIGKGEMSIISPTFAHSGIAGDEGVEFTTIMFDIKDLKNENLAVAKQLKMLLSGYSCFVLKTDNKQIITIAQDIIKMNNRKEEYHSLEFVGCIYRLLGILCRYCLDDRQTVTRSAENFADVISYINENFQNNISSSSISGRFNYDEAYFCRKFKSVTGNTATKYIQTLRLEHSRRLLEKTDMSIREISIACGFSDSTYYINCFRKMYGVSPLKYRKRDEK